MSSKERLDILLVNRGLFESREKLKKMVYSISGSVDLISTAVKDRNVLAIKTLKNFSKLKIAYILANDEDEVRAHASRTVSLKELYEAITASEEGGR